MKQNVLETTDSPWQGYSGCRGDSQHGTDVKSVDYGVSLWRLTPVSLLTGKVNLRKLINFSGLTFLSVKWSWW